MQHRHIPQRASRTQTQTQPPPNDDDDFDDADSYVLGMPRSALRYSMTQPYAIQQGNRRIVLHPELPPRRFHWSVFWGLGIIFTIAVLFVGSHVMAWWNDHQLDSTYGGRAPTRLTKWLATATLPNIRDGTGQFKPQQLARDRPRT